MGNDTEKKLNEIREAGTSPEAMAEYWKRLEVKLLAEVEKLRTKSPEELLQYAAENNIMILELQYQLNIHVEMIQKQQGYIDLLAGAVNKLIDKQEQETIDFAKVVKGKFEA